MIDGSDHDHMHARHSPSSKFLYIIITHASWHMPPMPPLAPLASAAVE
jgi:hypothetical protein